MMNTPLQLSLSSLARIRLSQHSISKDTTKTRLLNLQVLLSRNRRTWAESLVGEYRHPPPHPTLANLITHEKTNADTGMKLIVRYPASM